MKTSTDHRIAPRHRERSAIVYVRQSSPEQVRTNSESTRVQLGLRERAVALGWPRPSAIEDDLGVSASGFAERPGFARMLADICSRKVGIVLCLDVSRLSRNSKDWAHLLELCGFFDTLVADLDQVYDLAIPNDRLVLGIKGTVAELELSIIKTRMRTGLEAQAARGELKFIVPPGYTHDADRRIVKDPDLRVQAAISALFDQFDRATSARQVALWFRDTGTLFPVRKVRKTRTTAWEIPSQGTLLRLLAHPIYAGDYAYGRRNSRVECVDGRLVKRVGAPAAPEHARVYIQGHHEPYISKDRFVANLARIAQQRPRWTMTQSRTAIRDGLALLSGLLRCARCGRLLGVAYKRTSALYSCDGPHALGSKRCLSFGSLAIDRSVSAELIRALQPLAVDAARQAWARRCTEQQQATQSARLRLQAAKYEADRAFEQFDLADPKNRLVADVLEQRLNQRLADQHAARSDLEATANAVRPLAADEHQRLDALARDFPALWNHPNASAALKKRLLREAIVEIVVDHEPEQQRLSVLIHWQGGVHTRVYVEKRATPVGSKADVDLVQTVHNLAQTIGDADIARVLNMKRIASPRGLPWTQDRVLAFRRHHHITLCLDRRTDRLTGFQAAEHLGIGRNGLLGLIRLGALNKHQVTDFAPWQIEKAELASERVQNLVAHLKKFGRLPTDGRCSTRQHALLLPGSAGDPTEPT